MKNINNTVRIDSVYIKLDFWTKQDTNRCSERNVFISRGTSVFLLLIYSCLQSFFCNFLSPQNKWQVKIKFFTLLHVALTTHGTIKEDQISCTVIHASIMFLHRCSVCLSRVIFAIWGWLHGAAILWSEKHYSPLYVVILFLIPFLSCWFAEEVPYLHISRKISESCSSIRCYGYFFIVIDIYKYFHYISVICLIYINYGA